MTIEIEMIIYLCFFFFFFTVSNTASITATITTATSTTVTTANKVSEESNLPERRPSWRLRVDNGSKVCALRKSLFICD